MSKLVRYRAPIQYLPPVEPLPLPRRPAAREVLPCVIDVQAREVRDQWKRSAPGAIGLAVIAVVLDALLWRSVDHPTDWMLLYLTGGPAFTIWAACWGLGSKWAARVLVTALLASIAYLALA